MNSFLIHLRIAVIRGHKEKTEAPWIKKPESHRASAMLLKVLQIQMIKVSITTPYQAGQET